MGERVQKGMEGSIWKGVVWGNKWLGNASVGLSFKALFALEKMVYTCHGGFWRDIFFFLLHQFSPHSSTFFSCLWREFGLGDPDGACRKDKD